MTRIATLAASLCLATAPAFAALVPNPLHVNGDAALGTVLPSADGFLGLEQPSGQRLVGLC